MDVPIRVNGKIVLLTLGLAMKGGKMFVKGCGSCQNYCIYYKDFAERWYTFVFNYSLFL